MKKFLLLSILASGFLMTRVGFSQTSEIRYYRVPYCKDWLSLPNVSGPIGRRYLGCDAMAGSLKTVHVASVQSLQAIIDAQQALIEDLLDRVEALESR